jgi:1-acyl-sn-glycerol-3-phosphate acyltransferase
VPAPREGAAALPAGTVTNAGGAPGPFTGRLGALYVRLWGWRVEGGLPAGGKAVVIAAPHTSNWDLPMMLALAWVLGIRPRWLGKEELFRGPLGWLLRRLGGVPVARGRRTNLVRQAVDLFGTADRLVLVVPPSGTRSRATHWKSGFYHIARGAGVPIVLGFLDYGRKVGGLGPALVPSADLRADMNVMRAFYAGVTAKYPAQVTPVRLREEESAAAEPNGTAPAPDPTSVALEA